MCELDGEQLTETELRASSLLLINYMKIGILVCFFRGYTHVVRYIYVTVLLVKLRILFIVLNCYV